MFAGINVCIFGDKTMFLHIQDHSKLYQNTDPELAHDSAGG